MISHGANRDGALLAQQSRSNRCANRRKKRNAGEESRRAVEWEQAELHYPAAAPACGRRYTLARRATCTVVVRSGAETRAEVGRADREHCV